MCDQEPETLDHIILGCAFSCEVWHLCLDRLHLLGLFSVTEEPVLCWWLRVQKVLPKTLRRGFDSLVFLTGWRLWKKRNSRTFNMVPSSAPGLVEALFQEAERGCRLGAAILGVLLSTI
jgi:hypothetical protein